MPGLSRPGPDMGGGPDEQLPGKSRRGADVGGGPDERVPGHLHQGAHSTPHGLHSRQKYVKETPIRRRRWPLKGLSHEIFRPVFWPVWMRLGLNVNRLWF